MICIARTYYLQAGFWCQLEPGQASGAGLVTELSIQLSSKTPSYAWLRPATAKLMAILASGLACTRRLIVCLSIK